MIRIGDEDAHLRRPVRTIICAEHCERASSRLILARWIELPRPTAGYACVFGVDGVEEKVHVHISKPWFKPEGFKVYCVEIILEGDVVDAGLWR